MTENKSKKPESRKKKKKSGSSALPVFIFIIIIAGVAGSNFIGPAKGWISKLKDSGSANEKDTSEKPAKIAVNPILEDNENPPPPPKEEVNEIEEMHKNFMKEYIEKVKKPVKGKRYKVVTSSNDVRYGIYVKTDNYRVYLEDIQPGNVRTSIHYSKLKPIWARFFFTENAAYAAANKKVEEYLRSQNRIKEVEEPPENEVADNTSSSDKTKKSTSSRTYSRFKKYDITVADSSERLAHAALEVNYYLNRQSNIYKKTQGFKLVQEGKSHAKQQGNAAIFYMYVTSDFARKSEDFQYQIIDGVRRFWALRCLSNGVAGDENAYLCVVAQGKIIGGSNPRKADKIFVK